MAGNAVIRGHIERGLTGTIHDAGQSAQVASLCAAVGSGAVAEVDGSAPGAVGIDAAEEAAVAGDGAVIDEIEAVAIVHDAVAVHVREPDAPSFAGWVGIGHDKRIGGIRNGRQGGRLGVDAGFLAGPCTTRRGVIETAVKTNDLAPGVPVG